MREKMMEKMIASERRRNKMMEGMDWRKRWRINESDLIKKMGFVALNPLSLTIFRLLHSSRVSIDPRSRKLLVFAYHGVKEGLELFKSLEEFRDCIESKTMKALEGEIGEAAWKLEDALDSHVSCQILSQSGTGTGTGTESMSLGGDHEGCPFLYCLNLEGVEKDIDVFVEKVMEMVIILNPWEEDEQDEELEEEEDDDEEQEEKDEDEEDKEQDEEEDEDVRTSFISCFAKCAASVFLGMKEEYIKELEKLLPEEEEDFYINYALLLEGGYSRSEPEDRLRKVKDELMIWWISKAASLFVKEEKIDKPSPEDDGDYVSSRTGHALNMSNMVGLTDLFCKIRDDLCEGSGDLRKCAIVGMAGIGKTALAKKILQDPLISNKFECCIFVRMGPEYKWEDLGPAVLAQMFDGDKMLKEGHEDWDNFVFQSIQCRKCLIVLDDVWNRNPWATIFNHTSTWLGSQSWVLVTTRINEVARNVNGRIYQVPFLDKKESWDLLSGKIFGEKGCPRELEKPGKKIAENCEGLPLLIVTIADLLLKAEKTLEYWSKIAADKTNSIFVEAYEQISEVLYPSYSNLPQHLKACFLYLGAFPQNDEFRVSKLINMWSVDGFLGASYTLLEQYVGRFLTEIVSNNVALGTQWSSIFQRLKACSLHSVFWYLCRREARNEKFLHALNSYIDARVEDIECQRRLSIYKNVILSIKDVRDSIASMPLVRSLLCTGPRHQYQVPICFGLRLLKVLDALTIRFYEFPIEVMKLVQLRYLALTCNGDIPPSIGKLWGLQSLILHQHLSIKSSVSQAYLPVEIWSLQELEYLEIMGRNLSDPPPGVVLSSLLILLDVGAHTCTKRVLESIPKLEKLRVQIELMPGSTELESFCDDISHLQKLRSVQFVVVNPELMLKTVAPPPFFSFLYVRKLTLSGFGYPWEDMYKIADLFYIEELKLKCYAFRGMKWELGDIKFWRLAYLLIEDTDLVRWTGRSINFPVLESLTIKNCYKLQEIPKLSSEYSSIREIRLVDCNPSVVTYAKEMAPSNCSVYVDSSWLSDRKLS